MFVLSFLFFSSVFNTAAPTVVTELNEVGVYCEVLVHIYVYLMFIDVYPMFIDA